MRQEEILQYNKRCAEFLGYKCSINEQYELPNMMTFPPIGAGNKGKIMSEEAKLKISNSKKGKMSLEQKNSVIKNLEKGRKNNDYSHTKTEEFKKFSRNNMLRIRKDSSTVILQYSKSGDFIKEWSKIDDAAKHYNILNSAISNNLKGKSKTCKGFIWKYKN